MDMAHEGVKALATKLSDTGPGSRFVCRDDVVVLAQGCLALLAGLAEVEAVLDEVAAPDPDGKPLAQRVRDELADFHMVCDHASKVFCHVTDGAVGKVNTLPSVVCALADDVVTELVSREVEEARKEWEAERGEVVKACPHCGAHQGAPGRWVCGRCNAGFDESAYWQRVAAP